MGNFLERRKLPRCRQVCDATLGAFHGFELSECATANAIATTVAISDDDSSDVDAHLPVASWRENVEDEGNGDASSPPASARPKRTAAPKEEPEQVEDDEDEDEDGDEDLEDDVYVHWEQETLFAPGLLIGPIGSLSRRLRNT